MGRPRKPYFRESDGWWVSRFHGEYVRLARGRENEADEVAEINAEPGSEYVRFTSGRVMRLGDEIGGMREDVWRVQINTVKKHLKKEELLSEEEPLRFIFSHSAFRDGWDNPNVLQICTLNETRSAMKKRQDIGRGLRLPVNQHGLRVFDESANKLFVMANESYEDFARALQTEYEEDCGITFGKVPITAIAKITRVVEGEPQPIGRKNAEAIKKALVEQKMLDTEGRLQPAFNPKKPSARISGS